jgi:hypothetical protein
MKKTCSPFSKLAEHSRNHSWKTRLDIPQNKIGNNGFEYKVTRGKDEFEFIISPNIIEKEMQIGCPKGHRVNLLIK